MITRSLIRTYTHLIDTATLHSLIEAKTPNLRILNSSWYLPTSNKNAKAEVFESRIPSSFFFDIDKVSNTKVTLPHIIPDLEDFTKHMNEYKIRKNDTIVCYDNVGIYSSPRVWWMLRTYGCTNVKVLNGGFPKWLKENRPLDHKLQVSKLPLHIEKEGDFIFEYDTTQVVSYKNAKKLSDLIVANSTTIQLVDARQSTRFNGTVPEPRPGVRRGHIPGAINIPFTEVLTADGTEYLPLDEIKKIAINKKIDIKKPITFSCGSGVTACVPYLPFYELGTTCSVYNGSWSEYGSFPE
jgi:thiosulfate/3-mercaptopyruvate sulfurtransferase